jgi:23S rRNA pseudouridine1911/1915/1917 synthase
MVSFSASDNLPVVAAGPGWLVIDKPVGVSVHNDPGQDLCSRVTVMLTRDPHLATQAEFVPGAGVHAPHRLDRDTSGLVLLCCAASVLQFYGEAFQARQVGKGYLAILHGRLDAPGDDDRDGSWSFPLARSSGGRTNPSGSGKRMKSRTVFQVMEYSSHYTLVACAPLTGRKHQIRRQAKLAGHPVVGDRRYGSPRSLRYLKEVAGFDRLGLHAHSLDLPLRESEERRIIFSQALPAAFIQLLSADSERSATAWEAMIQDLPACRPWPSE